MVHGGGGDASDGQREALLGLIAHLKAGGYRFVTPTPATQARVLARRDAATARDLRDIFGWSLPFAPDMLDTALLRRLDAAGAIAHEDALLRSRLRVSTLGPDIYLHSAYPTDARDAVFFGPDSYRFAALIERELARCPGREGARLLDIGTGAGVGAIVAAQRCAWSEVVMTDINPAALALAGINAQAAAIAGRLRRAETLAADERGFDLILANPPYIIDSDGRAYRDGGDMHGGQVSIDMARDALPRLAKGGRFILYTGSAIIDGEDRIRRSLTTLAEEGGFAMRYEELDPDVFGEELEKPAYRGVERIALVAAVIERADG